MTTAQKITYTSKRSKSGLTDVLIDIYNSAGSKVVDAEAMTELGSTGTYYYDYTPASTGWHIYRIDSATEPALETGKFLSDYSTISTASVTTYTDTLRIIKASGIGIEIKNELLGTGDNANLSFDFANGNVIDGSYTLKYSATGNSANSFTGLTETTHYTIDLDSGSILLTTAGKSALGTNNLYSDYIHSPKMSDTIISGFVDSASAEVDIQTHNYWGTVKSTTDTQDGRDDNHYPETDEPYVADYDEPDFIQLKYKSVQTITSIVFMYSSTSSRTLDSDNYRFDDTGYITLLQDRLPLGKLNVQITYTHGYTSVPVLIQELASLYGALRAYVYISGGSYDDATGYTLGRKQVQIGEAWVNIREVIDQAKKRIDEILNITGRRILVG
jgi:hypothetical protein